MEQLKRNYPKSTVNKTLPMRTFNINRMSINKDGVPDFQVNMSTYGNLGGRLSEGNGADRPEEKKTVHSHGEEEQDPYSLTLKSLLNKDGEVENNQGIYRIDPVTKENLEVEYFEGTNVAMGGAQHFEPNETDPTEPDTSDTSDTSDISDTSETSETSDTSDAYVFDENFDKNLPSNVTLLTTPRGSKVYIVGTVHYSLESQREVAKLIKTVKPNCVVLELCKTRSIMLQWDEETFLKQAQNMSFREVLRKSLRMGFPEGLFFIVLFSLSTRMTKELGIAPGGEFRVAFKEARNIPHCKIFLGDLPIALTLKRLFSTLSVWQVLKIVTCFVFQSKKMSQEEVEKYRKMDEVEKILLQFAEESPDIAEVLVYERDAVLSYSMRIAAEKDGPNVVVGVVGLGHLMGIKEKWGKVTAEQIKKIVTIPKRNKYYKIIKFSIKFTTVGLILYGIHKLASRSTLYRGLFRSFFTTLS